MKSRVYVVLLSVLFAASLAFGIIDPNDPNTVDYDHTVVLTLEYVVPTEGDQFEKKHGDILIALDPCEAPITVANFEQYMEDGFYDGLIFHRVIPDFMIQGGGFEPNLVQRDPNSDGILNENPNGYSNVRGTIAMARTDDPNSATSQFFINVVDNLSLDPDPQGQTPSAQAGYCAFGVVLEGMDIADEIALLETSSQNGMDDVPINPVLIVRSGYLSDVGYCSAYPAGDFNADSLVDMGDFSTAASQWMDSGFEPIGLDMEEGWPVYYNGGDRDYVNDMIVDDQGNCYVVGKSKVGIQNYNFTVAKYDPNGTTLWSHSLNGTGNSSDEARAVTMDSEGNIYVTGHSYSNNSGVYTHDCTTIKFDPDGVQLWRQDVDGPAGKHDYAYAVAADEEGNCYIAGETEGSTSSFDYILVKHGPDGTVYWRRTFNGNFSNAIDTAVAVAADPNGNVIVTGNSQGWGTDDDIVTIQYDTLGNEIWQARYDGTYSEADRVTDMIVDAQSNIYLCGSTAKNNSISYMLALKYDEYGTQQWTDVRTDFSMGLDTANALALAADGSLITAGNITFTDAPEDDGSMVTLWIDAQGSMTGGRFYSANETDPNGPYGTAHDVCVVDNFIYVTGAVEDPCNLFRTDIATVKYTLDNREEIDVEIYSFEDAADNDTPAAIAADDEGYVYVAGTSNNLSFRPQDWVLLRYLPADLCTLELPQFDWNQDCVVDLGDLLYLAETWTETGELDFGP